MENHTTKKNKGNLIFAIIAIIVLYFIFSPSGPKCNNCHGAGKITAFGIKDKCHKCDGDGYTSKSDLKKWNSR